LDLLQLRIRWTGRVTTASPVSRNILLQPPEGRSAVEALVDDEVIPGTPRIPLQVGKGHAACVRD